MTPPRGSPSASPRPPPAGGCRPRGDWQGWQGTSGGRPVVAGLAALIRSATPRCPPPGLHRILDTPRMRIPGEDPVYGHGIIDARPPSRRRWSRWTATQNTIADWIRGHRRAESPDAVPRDSVSVPGRAASIPAPAATSVPQAAAPMDPAPGLQPALVLGTGLAAVALVGTGVGLAMRRRGR